MLHQFNKINYVPAPLLTPPAPATMEGAVTVTPPALHAPELGKLHPVQASAMSDTKVPLEAADEIALATAWCHAEI